MLKYHVRCCICCNPPDPSHAWQSFHPPLSHSFTLLTVLGRFCSQPDSLQCSAVCQDGSSSLYRRAVSRWPGVPAAEHTLWQGYNLWLLQGLHGGLSRREAEPWQLLPDLQQVLLSIDVTSSGTPEEKLNWAFRYIFLIISVYVFEFKRKVVKVIQSSVPIMFLCAACMMLMGTGG